ncbi:methyltransferase domain-containing protein [Herpetosiphon gulosus]|uniref:Methyltransferase type 11 domain-containing protein n=1 Tax=Herpetosiphon gulosus TaxID=1973496 RepID=A0ABP9X278_9CHLR
MAWIPQRSQALELLDELTEHPELAANLTEMAWLYRLSGGYHLGWRLLQPFLQAHTSLLDLGAGNGQIGRWLQAASQQQSQSFQTISLDLNRTIVASNQQALVGTGQALPFADRSIDIVFCAQMLHHCSDIEVVALLREAQRVACRGIVLVDLQRSWLGYWGARLVGLGPLTSLGKHDGPLSVLRAWRSSEIQTMVQAAGIQRYHIEQTSLYWGLAIEPCV